MSRDAAASLFSLMQRQLWVVTAAAGDRRGGLVATFVSRASIVESMPRVLVGLGVRQNTTELVEQSSALVAHLLTETEADWVWNFGLDSGRDRDKLAGLDTRTGSSGAPVLSAAKAWLECRVEKTMATGDRVVALADVIDAAAEPDLIPLTVERLREIAPPHRLERMDQLFARDGELDARLIAEFRRES